ncbi:response regulator [Sulfitobacter sp.]|uniref:response regulator n=1 Tax=Sulfitobacter sp. TaxID=1903071 RepID=UPI003EF432F5
MTNEMNILLVEDNDLEVAILERSMKKMDLSNSLMRARDGLEALDFLKENLVTQELPYPFVILLDINMPRMNGHEFLAELRATEDLKASQVYVFTTSDSKKDVNQAYRNNANGYIVKPDSTSELTDILKALREFWSICENPNLSQM